MSILTNPGLLEFLAKIGMTEVVVQGPVANPTEGEGVVLFGVTVPEHVMTYAFILINDSDKPTTYVYQRMGETDWEDVTKPVVPPHMPKVYDYEVQYAPGDRFRVLILSDPDATGTSHIIIAYVQQ